MAKAKDNSMHWVIGIVLLITGVLIIAALVVTYSSAQGGNVNANVNIDNDPPVVDTANAEVFQDPADDGTNTALVGFTGTPGPTVSHTVAGNTNVIVRVNVSDSNGWATQPINLSAKLYRTDGGGTSISLPFENATGDNRQAPATGPSACTAIANISATERTFLCGINMKYNGQPTTTNTAVSPIINVSAEHWRVLLKASDTVTNVEAFDGIHYEYALGIGLSTSSLVDLGSIATDGTPGSTVATAIQNYGNQYIDVTSQVTESTDAAAWACSGTGNPLVSDLHLAEEATDTNYAAMDPLNFNGAAFTHTEMDIPVTSNSISALATDMNFRMATTQAITPGTCTLSSIVFSAIKGF